MHAVILMFRFQIFGLAFAIPIFVKPFSSPSVSSCPLPYLREYFVTIYDLIGCKEVKEIRNLS